jgi:hypothetical protein
MSTRAGGNALVSTPIATRSGKLVVRRAILGCHPHRVLIITSEDHLKEAPLGFEPLTPTSPTFRTWAQAIFGVDYDKS